MHAYVCILLMCSAAVAMVLWFGKVHARSDDAVRQAAFHVVSLATTTGYAAADYLLWPAFMQIGRAHV